MASAVPTRMGPSAQNGVEPPACFTDKHNKAEFLSSQPVHRSAEEARQAYRTLFSVRLQTCLLSSLDSKSFSCSRPNVHRLNVEFNVPQIHPTRIPLPRFLFGPSTKHWFVKTIALPFKPLQLVFDWRAKSNAFWLTRNTYLALQKTLDAAEFVSMHDVDKVVSGFESIIKGKIDEIKNSYANPEGFWQKFNGKFHLNNPWGQYKSLKRTLQLNAAIKKQIGIGLEENEGQEETKGSGSQLDSSDIQPTLLNLKMQRLQTKHSTLIQSREFFVSYFNLADDCLKDNSILINALGLFLKYNLFSFALKLRIDCINRSIEKLNQRIDSEGDVSAPSSYVADLSQPDGIKNHRRRLAHQAELLNKLGLMPKLEDGIICGQSVQGGLVVSELEQRIYTAFQNNLNDRDESKQNTPKQPIKLASFYYDEFFSSVESYSNSLPVGNSSEPSISSAQNEAKLKEISAHILASHEGKGLRRNMREWVCILKEASKREGSGLDEEDIKAIRNWHDKLVNKHAFDITKISQVVIHSGYGLRAQEKQRLYTNAIPEIVRLLKKAEGGQQRVSSRLMRYNLDVPNLLLELSGKSWGLISDDEKTKALQQLQTIQGKTFFGVLAKHLKQLSDLFDGELDGVLKRFSRGKVKVEDLQALHGFLRGSVYIGKEKLPVQAWLKKLVIEHQDVFFETSAIDFFQNEFFNWSKLLTKNRRYKNAEFMSKVFGLDLNGTMANYRRAHHAMLKHGNAWIQTSAKTSAGLGMAAALISNLVPWGVMCFNVPLGKKLSTWFLPMIADLSFYIGFAIVGLFDPILPLLAALAKNKRIQELEIQFQNKPDDAQPDDAQPDDAQFDEEYQALAAGSASTQNVQNTQPAVRSFWKEFKQCHGAAHKASFKTIYSGAAESLQWVYDVASRSFAEKASGNNEALAFEDHATQYLSKAHHKLLKGSFLFATKGEAELDGEVVECLKVMAYSLAKVVVVAGGGTLAVALGLMPWLGKLLGSAVIKTWSPELPILDETMSDGVAVKQPELSKLESLDFEDFKRNLILIIKDIFDNPFGLIKYLPNIAANILAFSVALLDFLFHKMTRINPPDEASVKALAAVDNSSSPSSSLSEVGRRSGASGARSS